MIGDGADLVLWITPRGGILRTAIFVDFTGEIYYFNDGVQEVFLRIEHQLIGFGKAMSQHMPSAKYQMGERL
jgi:hypothetical protein